MRIYTLIRLAAILGVTALAAFYFGTAPVSDIPSVRQFPSNSAPSAQDTGGTDRVLAAETDPHDQAVMADAFSLLSAELLWSGSIPLASRGEDTLTNVLLAAEAIDLTALQPNEIFSFNGVVGIRSEEKGYRPGLMYSQGEVVTGIGGGICIVSTLLYKGALESGLKILDRHPHSGPVSYADPGRDAAVSFGWADLRFKNNTGHLLLVRATVSEDELVVALYGKKRPGFSVEVAVEDFEEIPYKIFEKEDETVPEGEVRVERKARPGYAVTIVRLIEQDGETTREVISHDTVLPQHKLILIPPKPREIAPETPEALPVPATTDAEAPTVSGTIHLDDEPSPTPQPETAQPSDLP